MREPLLSYDDTGTPGFTASDPVSGYFGQGWLHGRHRPLQTLLLHTAARGRLASLLFPRADLLLIDTEVARLDLFHKGESEARRLDATTAERLDAYLSGLGRGLSQSGGLFKAALGLGLPRPDRPSTLSALMLSAYLGGARGQERMERALVAALCEGANPRLLEAMFDPHLRGWDPTRLARLKKVVGPGFGAQSLVTVGGSNAWAVHGDRTKSGVPILCGDPHLQVDQLPSLFFELRARVGDEIWLGATIPGLPGMAVGRNRRVAWAGTFACADNVDFSIETFDDTFDGTVDSKGSGRGGAREHLVAREVEIKRRLKSTLRLRFYASERGTLESEPADSGEGEGLAVRWAGSDLAAESLGAFMALPMAESAREAEQLLQGAHCLSLHYVLADRGGDVRYCQVGRIPKRSHRWSGLYPADSEGTLRWLGYYQGALLPRSRAKNGVVVSANEARPAPDGAPLATMAQPTYRLRRIGCLLASRSDHDRDSMRALQLDVVSEQARLLVPRFVAALRNNAEGRRLACALETWDFSCSAESVGAHAFDVAYRAARGALADELGGGWLHQMLRESELGVWWCRAFDRVLSDQASWTGARGERLRRALVAVGAADLAPWGQVQQFTLSHMILGGLPKIFGYDRGPYPLPGSIATVCQGNLVPTDGQRIAVGPAYRMIADLADDALWTSMPGGVDDSRFSGSYSQWLNPWRAGVYHRLLAPDPCQEALR